MVEDNLPQHLHHILPLFAEWLLNDEFRFIGGCAGTLMVVGSTTNVIFMVSAYPHNPACFLCSVMYASLMCVSAQLQLLTKYVVLACGIRP